MFIDPLFLSRLKNGGPFLLSISATRLIPISLPGKSSIETDTVGDADQHAFRTFKKYERVVIQMHADACLNTENEINFLEHVQSKVSVKVKYRGA